MLGIITSARVMSSTSDVKGRKTARGWSIIAFSDTTGEMEGCAFGKCHEQISGWIGTATGIPALFAGTLSRPPANATDDKSGRIRFALDDVTPLDGRQAIPGTLSLALSYEDNALVSKAVKLQTILKQHPGHTPVCLELRYSNGTVVTISLPERISVTSDLLETLEPIIGAYGYMNL